MVDLLPVHADSVPSERFVSSGRQLIPLTGYQDLEPDDVLGIASLPLLRVLLKTLTPFASPTDVSAFDESSTTPASQPAPPPNTSDPPDEPPPELLHRLDYSQRESFLRLWNTVPPHIRRIDFALDAAGWDPAALGALSTTLVTYADGRLFVVQTGLRRMLHTPFPNQGAPRDSADPIAPLQTELSPFQTGRCHLGLLPRRWPHPALHVTVVEPSRMCSEEIGRHPNHSQLPKTE